MTKSAGTIYFWVLLQFGRDDSRWRKVSELERKGVISGNTYVDNSKSSVPILQWRPRLRSPSLLFIAGTSAARVRGATTNLAICFPAIQLFTFPHFFPFFSLSLLFPFFPFLGKFICFLLRTPVLVIVLRTFVRHCCCTCRIQLLPITEHFFFFAPF